jgi:hypothetical protein
MKREEISRAGSWDPEDRLHQAIICWREDSAKSQKTTNLSGCIVYKTLFLNNYNCNQLLQLIASSNPEPINSSSRYQGTWQYYRVCIKFIRWQLGIYTFIIIIIKQKPCHFFLPYGTVHFVLTVKRSTPKVAMKWVAILLCIHEAPSSTLGAETAIVRRSAGYLSPSRQM